MIEKKILKAQKLGFISHSFLIENQIATSVFKGKSQAEQLLEMRKKDEPEIVFPWISTKFE